MNLPAQRGFDSLDGAAIAFDHEVFKTPPSIPVALGFKVEPGAKVAHGDGDILERLGIDIVFPMKSRAGELLGLLAMGAKKSGLRYSLEDMDLLSVVSRQAELAFERILLQQRLMFEREERERLEEINRMKTFFVSSVSHELKTPLTAIRLFAEMLGSKSGAIGWKARRYLRVIDGESGRLSRLIENVLTIAKAERSSFTYEMKPVSLNGIVRKTMKMLEYELKKENCRTHVSLRCRRDDIEGDADALTAALANLITNAAQYSPRKKRIAIETFSPPGFVGVSVKDRGTGIPAEELPYIFEPFYRGASTSKIRSGGTGLGLAVVKNIVEAHGGMLEVASTQAIGTKISVLFPAIGGK